MALLALVLLSFAGCKRRQADSAPRSNASSEPKAAFIRLMNTGKNYLDQGQAQKALEVYQQAEKLMPADADVHMNLANANLLADNENAALREDEEA